MAFFKGIASGMFLVTTLWLLLLWGQVGNPTPQSQWVHDATLKKEHIATNTKSPKLLIVAGSNALFGINSRKLSGALGIPVVNLGVNAGLGLPYILHRSLVHVHAGDTVLLPLEYDMYLYDGTVPEQLIDYLYARDSSYLVRMSFFEQLQALFRIRATRVLEGYLATTPTAPTGDYGIHHIDEYGDQTHTHIQAPHHKEAIDKSTPWNYGKRPHAPLHPTAKAHLRAYVNAITARGARALFVPPAFMAQPHYYTDPAERSFYKSLPVALKNEGFAFLGDPFEVMYAPNQMHNTDYHLNATSRQAHTIYLANLLCFYFVTCNETK